MIWSSLGGQLGPNVTLGLNSQSPIPMRGDVLFWPAIRIAVRREFESDFERFKFHVDNVDKQIAIVRLDKSAKLAIKFRGDRFTLVAEGARDAAEELERRGKALVESVVDNPRWLVPLEAEFR